MRATAVQAGLISDDGQSRFLFISEGEANLYFVALQVRSSMSGLSPGLSIFEVGLISVSVVHIWKRTFDC